MSDEDTETTGEVAAGLRQAGAGFSALRTLFKAITVPEVVHLRDRWGTTYEVVPYLSMRQELACAVMLDEILTSQTAPVQVFQEAQAMLQGGQMMAGVAHFLRGALFQPALHGHVDALLELILADLLPEVRGRAAARWEERGRDGDPPTAPMDLLRSADVVESLGFFFAQSATSIADAMANLADTGEPVSTSPALSPATPSAPS